jgi:integrase
LPAFGSSELRGLRWEDIDFDTKVLHVRQRADQWGTISVPNSAAGEREIAMSPSVVNALREWRLICPRLKSNLHDQGTLSGSGSPGKQPQANVGVDPSLLLPDLE